MIRLAIIGVGWAGERQIQAIQELNRKISVECLVDTDSDYLAQKAMEYNISKTYTDYQSVLRDPTIDAVSICTPHSLHCEMAVSAAAASKHILCEKPIALTLDDANQMISAAMSHDVKLYIAENWSYTPAARFLQQMVQSGDHIGHIVSISGYFGFQARNFGYPGRRDWLTQPEQGGTGTWMLHGIHTIAQIRYIFGEITSVYAQEGRSPLTERSDIEASVNLLMRLKTGAMFSLLQTSEVKLPKELWGYTIHGDSGSIRAYDNGYELYNQQTEWRPTYTPYPDSTLSDYALEIEAFADYVLEGRIGPTTGLSERNSLQVVLAGYRSMQTGLPVPI